MDVVSNDALNHSAEIPPNVSLAMDTDDEDGADNSGSDEPAAAAAADPGDELNGTETLAMSDSDGDGDEDVLSTVNSARQVVPAASKVTKTKVEPAKKINKKPVAAIDTHAFSSDDETAFAPTVASLQIVKESSAAATNKQANKKSTADKKDSKSSKRVDKKSSAAASKKRTDNKSTADEAGADGKKLIANKLSKRVGKKSSTAIFDSESDVDNNEQPVTAAASTATKQLSALCDEDSEDDQNERQDASAPPAPKRINKKTSAGKKRAILGDDGTSDDEHQSTATTVPKRVGMKSSSIATEKLSALCDEESEDDKNERKVKSATSAPKRRNTKTSKIDKKRNTSGDDEDDSGDTSDGDDNDEATAATKLAALCDNEDSSDDADYKAPDAEDASTAPVVATPRPPKRASAREADDQMKLIQSESQRMAREASLSVPYHRPKQHSLKAFLGRRTVTGPTGVLLTAQRPAASIKMSDEQLELYARSLEERALESQQFFKSESESEEEEVEQEKVEDQSAQAEAEVATAETTRDAVVEQPEPLLTDDEVVASTSIAPLPAAAPIMSRLDRLKERINAQLTPANSTISPSLKGEANTLIDLDSGAVLPGRKAGPTELYERFLRHSKPAAAAAGGSLRVLSADATGLSMETVVLSENLGGGIGGQGDEIIQDSKPRSAFFKLKAELGKKLALKRSEEIARRKGLEQKKVQDEKSCCGDDEEEEEADDKVNDYESDEEKDAEGIDDAENEAGADNETGADHDDDADNEDDEDSDESDVDITADKTQPRKRIILAADSDEEDLANEAKPVEPLTIPMSSDVSALLQNVSTVDAVAPENTSAAGNFLTQNADVTESQLVDLCSGVFQTQMPIASDDVDTASVAGDPENPSTQDLVTDVMASVKAVFESSDEDDGDVNAEDKTTKSKQPRVIRKLSDDEDDDDDAEPIEEGAAETAADSDRLIEYDSEENEIVADAKTATKKKRKRKELKTAEDSSSSSDEDEDDPAAAADAIVEYDSDENVVKVVRQTVAERQKRARAFIENEAELSESEWGSADEDEQQLDRMEIELGDSEQFDNDQLREELGRIHMRRLLDADQREVRIITEQLLPEEEELGAQRERQFKWKNMNDSNWATEGGDQVGDDGATASQQPGSDDENEEEWRKMRHEREQLLKDLKDGHAAADLTDARQEDETLNGSATADAAVRKRKITVIRKSGTPQQLQTAKQPSFLIGKSTEFQVIILVASGYTQ